MEEAMQRLRRVVDIVGEELEALRIAYEGNVIPVAEVCETWRMSRSTLRKLVILHGWRQRHPRRIDPSDVIGRLFRLLDAQIRELEKDMTKAGASEAAMLGRLVATLDKLIGMKNAQAAVRAKPRRTREMSDIKARLIERIEQLKRG
jgi:hypothetical protein